MTMTELPELVNWDLWWNANDAKVKVIKNFGGQQTCHWTGPGASSLDVLYVRSVRCR